MRIGITFDLKSEYIREGWTEEDAAEFDSEETIVAIEESLWRLGHDTDRIGRIHDLVLRLCQGERWDLVFNVAEGAYGAGREAQIPAILDAYQIPYTFSDPVVLCLTLHKAYAKHIVMAYGVPTAECAFVKDQKDIEICQIPFPVFVKPVGEGTGKGIGSNSMVCNVEELREVCSILLNRYKQPVLVERYLPGREFTVGIVGSDHDAQALGVMEIIFHSSPGNGVYSYEAKKYYQEKVDYRLVDDTEANVARDLALLSWRALGCRDAGRVDVRSDEHGIPHFLEVNPLAGLHPIHSDLPILCRLVGMEYINLIKIIIDEAVKRTEKTKKI